MGLVFWTPERLPGRAGENRGHSAMPHAAAGTVRLRFREGGRRSRGVAVTFGLLAAGALALAQSGSLPARADSDSTAAPTADSAQSGADPVVDLDVTNANMLAVVELLRRPGGTQFIISGDPKLFKPVTVHLTAPLSKMLEYVATSAGATVTKDEYGVYTIRPTDPNAPVAEATPKVTTGDVPAPPEQPAQPVVSAAPLGPMHWESVVLSYVQPSFVTSFLNVPERPISSPYQNESSDNDQPYHELGRTINPNFKVINGNAVDRGEGSSSVQSTGQAGVPLGTGLDLTGIPGRATSTAGSLAQQFPGGGNPGGAFPGGAAGPGQNGQARIDLRPAGVDQIIGVPEQNLLLVRGTSQGISELRDIIAKLDLPPKEVSIKVEFVTASIDSVDQLGIAYDMIPFPGVSTGFSSPSSYSGNISQTGYTQLTYSYGNVAASLLALLTSTTGKEIAAPILTLTNGIPGSVEITEEIPVTTTTTVAQGSGNALSGSSVGFEPIPTGLTATARINGDNSVTLQLVPIVSTVGAASSTGAVATTSQEVNTIMTVGNGETVVMGGLVQKTDNNTRYQVPILGDLPIIGSMFRSRNDTRSDSELLVFVTPTILPPPGATTTGEQAAPVENGAVSVGVGVTP